MKKISILGTGGVGNTIGAKLIELGYEVMMGSRTANNEKALAFASKFPGKAYAGTFHEAISFSDMIFNCSKGEHSVDALKSG